MKTPYIFLFLLIPFLVSAQSIQLKGKVLDEKKNPVKNLSIRFTSIGNIVTTNSGEFVITVPQSFQSVEAVLTDAEWQILFPTDSKIPLPSDPNFISTILVSKNSSEPADLDKSIKRYSELEKLLKELGSTSNDLKDFLEKYVELESKRLEIDEAKLRDEFQKREKREEIYSIVQPVLSELILRLKNLKAGFENNFEIAFYSDSVTQKLNRVIKAYNPVFDSINNNYKSWQKIISTNWEENLSEKFSSTVSYLIDEVHKPYVFQLNEQVKIINMIRFGGEKDEDKIEKMKSDAKNNLDFILKALDIRIPILEGKVDEIINRLQFAEMN